MLHSIRIFRSVKNAMTPGLGFGASAFCNGETPSRFASMGSLAVLQELHDACFTDIGQKDHPSQTGLNGSKVGARQLCKKMIQADVFVWQRLPQSGFVDLTLKAFTGFERDTCINENPSHPDTVLDLPVQPFPISGVLDVPVELTRQVSEGSASHRSLLMPIAIINETTLAGANHHEFTHIVDHS